jgi:hypothetical protein
MGKLERIVQQVIQYLPQAAGIRNPPRRQAAVEQQEQIDTLGVGCGPVRAHDLFHEL